MSNQTKPTTTKNPDVLALQAACFGYAGHSLVTPHQAIQQIWWTDKRIDEVVTRDFISSKLKPGERIQLDRPMFDDRELSDDTYLEWIQDRARRLFLTLVECGAAGQIFNIVDAAWDDNDLPLSPELVENLQSFAKKDDRSISKKFYNAQFAFLLRILDEGDHIQYGINEYLPLVFIHPSQRLPPAAALQSWRKAHLPNQVGRILVQRKIILAKDGFRDEVDPEQEKKFLKELHEYFTIHHRHVAPVFASYTLKGAGYILSPYEPEHTLKTFFDFKKASSIRKLSKEAQTKQFLSWIHCLASALVSIHTKNLSHSGIQPSNILINSTNKIAFSDLGRHKFFQTDKKIDPMESYNYMPPETLKHQPYTTLSDAASPRLRFRKFSTDSFRSSGAGTSRSQLTSLHSSKPSLTSVETQYIPALTHSKKNSVSSDSSGVDLPTPQTPDSPDSDSGHIPVLYRDRDKATLLPSLPSMPSFTSLASLLPFSSYIQQNAVSSVAAAANSPFDDSTTPIVPLATLQKGDIYSLGCVYLDILTFTLQKSPSSFTKHRSTKIRQAEATKSNQPKSRPHRRTASNTANLTSYLPPSAASTAYSNNYPSPPIASISKRSSSVSTIHSSSSSKIESSFHANPAAVHSWIDNVLTPATKELSPTNLALAAIPSLLALVRAMISRNPALRPDAAAVRYRLESILYHEARLQLGPDQDLCCGNVMFPPPKLLGSIVLPPLPPVPPPKKKTTVGQRKDDKTRMKKDHRRRSPEIEKGKEKSSGKVNRILEYANDLERIALMGGWTVPWASTEEEKATHQEKENAKLQEREKQRERGKEKAKEKEREKEKEKERERENEKEKEKEEDGKSANPFDGVLLGVGFVKDQVKDVTDTVIEKLHFTRRRDKGKGKELPAYSFVE